MGSKDEGIYFGLWPCAIQIPCSLGLNTWKNYALQGLCFSCLLPGMTGQICWNSFFGKILILFMIHIWYISFLVWWSSAEFSMEAIILHSKYIVIFSQRELAWLKYRQQLDVVWLYCCHMVGTVPDTAGTSQPRPYLYRRGGLITCYVWKPILWRVLGQHARISLQMVNIFLMSRSLSWEYKFWGCAYFENLIVSNCAMFTQTSARRWWMVASCGWS